MTHVSYSRHTISLINWYVWWIYSCSFTPCAKLLHLVACLQQQSPELVSSLEMSPLGYLGGLKGLYGQAPLGASENMDCEVFPDPWALGKTADIPRSLLNPMAASCGAGIVSALIPYSFGFAESLCFSDQEMIKIKLILGGEDGKLFGELLFFGFSVEHALLSPSCTHVSPSQCRGKFPAHHWGCVLGQSCPHVCHRIIAWWWAFPLIIFHSHLFIFQNGILGGEKKFKPIAQNLGASACVGAFLIPVPVQCLEDNGERCWVLLAKGELLPASLPSICGEGKVSHGADVGRKTWTYLEFGVWTQKFRL